MATKEKSHEKIHSIKRDDLPKLPADWNWVPFSSVCDRVSVGHVGPTAEYFRDRADGITFLRSQNVRPGRLVLETATAISPEFHQKLKKSKLQAGDILFVRVGANRGDCCVVPQGVGELNCANIVFARPKHPTGFHAYFFQSKLGQSLLHSASVGAAQGVINTGSVASMPVPLPPLPTQRKIAGILSAYDDLIENNLRRIKILEEMAQSLYREWFVHFRFPGHESAKFVDSALGQIPRGWEVKKLEQILELKYGKALKKEDRRDGQYPVFGSSGIVGTHDISLTKGPGIVVGRKGNVGSVFWSDEDFFVIDTAYFVDSHMPLRFLFYLLPTLNFINSDAAVPGLSRQQAYSLETIVPPNGLLTKFCTLADIFEKQASTHRRQNQNLRQSRDLLLPKLLSSNTSVD
jgi:type I restriction enzyme, S subunit